MDTFLYQVDGENGFFYHFVNMETGKREWNCEVSIIDTGIFICGAIAAGEYFGGEVKQKADLLYRNINWKWYTDTTVNQFYMGYTPERGFKGHWDQYAEQLMLYILGVASPTYSVTKDLYDNFKKPKKDYGEIKDIVYTYGGTLFTYQFSHAWIDFRNRKDEDGIDWFENSIKATKADKKYCMDHEVEYRTFGENSWGLTPCITPKGYNVDNGTEPCDTELKEKLDGTVAPCGAIGSLVFTPEDSIEAMQYMYKNIPGIWGRYGLRDGYNCENGFWVSEEYLGIDEGVSMIMIENYLSEAIWKSVMKNEFIKEGMKLLGIEEKKKSTIR